MSDPIQNDELLPVEQVDREAAADLAEWLQGMANIGGNDVAAIRNGFWDSDTDDLGPLVQAFARHRITATRQPEALRCDVETNETGCLHPVEHRGSCGYSTRQPDEGARELLIVEAEAQGLHDVAKWLRTDPITDNTPYGLAIGALKRALAKPAPAEVAG